MELVTAIKDAPAWVRWPLWAVGFAVAIVIWAAASATVDEGTFKDYLRQGLALGVGLSVVGASARLLGHGRWRGLAGPFMLAGSLVLAVTNLMPRPVEEGALIALALVGGMWAADRTAASAAILGVLSAVAFAALTVVTDGRLLAFAILCAVAACAFALAWRLQPAIQGPYIPRPPAGTPPPTTYSGQR